MKKRNRIQRQKVRASKAMRRFIKSFPPYLLIIAFALPVLAAEGPGEKLAEGVGDAATGWVEVPKEMADTTEETNVLEGVTVGTVKGTGEAVVKTTKGVIDAATFYIPDDKKEEEADPDAEQ